MRKDLTHVVLVVDRSGSMSLQAADASGGINELVKEQREKDGDCTISMYEFSDSVEETQSPVDIQKFPQYTMRVGGMTALHDGIGTAIDKTGAYLSAMKEEDRPGLVMVVIVTDGGENSSREYDGKRTAEMIKTQDEEFSWQFSYIGANQDSFAVANSLNIKPGAVADYDENNTKAVWDVTSKMVARGRAVVASGKEYTACHTDNEKMSLKD